MENIEGIKKYIVLTGIILIILAGFFAYRKTKNTLEVEIIQGEIAEISDNVYTEAKLNSDKDLEVLSQVNGEVKKVNHTIGDLVNKGDILYELDKKSIEEELKELEEYLENEEKNTEMLKNDISPEEVEEKSKLIQELEDELTIIREEEIERKTSYELGEISLEDYQEILEKKIAKESEYEEARRDFQIANRALIQNLNMESMGRLNELRLRKKYLEDLIENHTITADIGGVVMEQKLKKGDYINPKDHLMTIGRVENIYLTTVVPNDILDRIRKGVKVVIIGKEIKTSKNDISISKKDDGLIDLEDESTKKYQGVVGEVNVDRLKLDLNEDGAVVVNVYSTEFIKDISANMKFNIGVEVDRKKDVLVIPEDVIIDGEYVYVLNGNRAEKREVVIGIEDGKGLAEIISGVEKDDLIISSSLSKIEDGDRVRVIKKE